jgi:hypothetical protein
VLPVTKDLDSYTVMANLYDEMAGSNYHIGVSGGERKKRTLKSNPIKLLDKIFVHCLDRTRNLLYDKDPAYKGESRHFCM